MTRVRFGLAYAMTWTRIPYSWRLANSA